MAIGSHRQSNGLARMGLDRVQWAAARLFCLVLIGLSLCGAAGIGGSYAVAFANDENRNGVEPSDLAETERALPRGRLDWPSAWSPIEPDTIEAEPGAAPVQPASDQTADTSRADALRPIESESAESEGAENDAVKAKLANQQRVEVGATRNGAVPQSPPSTPQAGTPSVGEPTRVSTSFGARVG
ncbi:MAG: hypothetical protein AAFO75_03630, partial [Pseudomonadota bacterium]